MPDICVIMATGPSANEINLEPLRGKVDLMCVNKPILNGMMNHWVFIDGVTAEQFGQQFDNNEHAHIWTTENTKRRHCLACLTTFRRKKGIDFGVNLRDNTVPICGSSTYLAVQVAALLDYKRVYIFGVDGGPVSGQMWCNGRKNTVGADVRPPGFAREAKVWEWLADQDLPIVPRLVFCSSYNERPWIKKFVNLKHETAVQCILDTEV